DEAGAADEVAGGSDPGSLPLPARVETDTAASYRALCLYAQQPPGHRSLAALAETLGHRSKRGLERWSTDHDWQARIAAWDQQCREHRWSVLETERQRRQLEQLEAVISVQHQARMALDRDVVPALVRIVQSGRVEVARVTAARLLVDLAG